MEVATACTARLLFGWAAFSLLVDHYAVAMRKAERVATNLSALARRPLMAEAERVER